MSEERDVLTGDVPQVAPRDEPVRRETLREVAQTFMWVVDQAERARRPPAGASVSWSGDFANVSPNTANELRWWACRMRDAIERENKEGSR